MRNSKKNKIIKIAAASVLSITTVIGYLIYRDLSSYEEGIQEPFAESIPFITSSFDNKDGFELHQPNGTHVAIPKNAFVDEKGKRVKGKIELKFREFHTAESILMSGIPMQMLDERNEYMESLGMMELRAFKNGKELSLKKGKTINVDLASTEVPNKDFNLYLLEGDKEWKETGIFKTVNNDRRDSAFANLTPLPETPESPDPDSTDVVFTLNGAHLKAYKGVEWRLIKSKNEPVPYWAFRLNWDKIKVEEVKGKRKLFDLTFNYSQKNYRGKTVKQTFTARARPLLTGKELKLAKAAYKKEFENYQLMAAKLELEEKRLEQESSVLNRFTVNNMGVFNIDQLKSLDVYAKVELAFDFQANVSAEFNKVLVMMVMEEINAVVKYNAFDWDEVSVIDTPTELIMVLPGDIIASVSAEEFKKKINTSTTSKHFTNSVYFETEKMTMKEYLNKKDKSRAIPMFL